MCSLPVRDQCMYLTAIITLVTRTPLIAAESCVFRRQNSLGISPRNYVFTTRRPCPVFAIERVQLDQAKVKSANVESIVVTKAKATSEAHLRHAADMHCSLYLTTEET
jgi:hypothetical protein